MYSGVRKTAFLLVRITPEEHGQVKIEAAARGVAVSAFVRERLGFASAQRRKTRNEAQRIHRQKRRLLLDTLKNVPCADCGKSYPTECMDFDHVRGVKKFNIGQQTGRSIPATLREAEKCDVVCANCHRARTQYRLLDKRNGVCNTELSVDSHATDDAPDGGVELRPPPPQVPPSSASDKDDA